MKGDVFMHLDFINGNIHPRLYFSEEVLEAFRKSLDTDKEARLRFDSLRQNAEELLKQPYFSEEYANASYTQHGNYFEIGDQLISLTETLGFLYQVTREKKYADKIKDALLHYASFAVWTGPANKDREVSRKCDLSTTKIVQSYALGYDCITDTLTPEEEAVITGALINKGIIPLMEDWVLPNTRIHALDSMGHNWWAVCIGIAGIGIIALYEKFTQADDWMSMILEALRGFCSYSGGVLLNKPSNFDDQGMFYESSRYFNFGIGELLRFSFVFRNNFSNHDAVKYPELDKAADAFMSMSYPTSDKDRPFLFVNFGDSMVDENFVLLPMFLLLNNLGSNYLKKYYQSVKKTWDFLDFLYNDQLWSKAGDFPVTIDKMKVFPGTGYMFIRNSWEPDSTLLAARCGFTWNHAHDDAGSFIIFDRGRPIIIDSGTISYSDPLYRGYYSKAEAHNVIMVNNKGQFHETIERGSKFSGTFPHFVECQWAKYVLADATGPMADQCYRNYRNFLWLGKDILVVIDDLRTYEPSSFDFLLHYQGNGKAEGDEIHIQNDVSALRVKALYPEKKQITVKEGYLEWRPQTEKISAYYAVEGVPVHPYFVISSEGKVQTQQFFNVFLLNDAAKRVKIEKITGANYLGFRLTDGSLATEVYYNMESDGRRMHVNSNNNVNGYETDTYILAAEYEHGIPRRYLLVYGSYLRKDGISHYESFKKEYIDGIFNIK